MLAPGEHDSILLERKGETCSLFLMRVPCAFCDSGLGFRSRSYLGFW